MKYLSLTLQTMMKFLTKYTLLIKMDIDSNSKNSSISAGKNGTISGGANQGARN